MMTRERVLELMKQAGLDEKKFWALLAKEDPNLSQEELDSVNGGRPVGVNMDYKTSCD